ncbi:MAG: YncE family protein, partial [Candidatus Micrarchaeota archaeon]|nr:YncE family protein [Candidatus Micrarchaeota archaeon]
IAVGSSPWGIAINPQGNLAYVTDQNSGKVYVILTATNTIYTTISLSSILYGVTFNPSGTLAYVVNYGGKTVNVINVATNSLSATISVGSSPVYAAFNPSGSIAYVTNSGSGTVSVINVGSSTVINTITLGTEPGAVAFSPTGTLAYVANYGSGTVNVINVATNTIVNTINIGINPSYIAINPSGSLAYVVNSGSPDTVNIINLATNTLAEQAPTGSNPWEAAFNPSGTMVYVVNQNDNTVSVIGDVPDSRVQALGTQSSNPLLQLTINALNSNTLAFTFNGAKYTQSTAQNTIYGTWDLHAMAQDNGSNLYYYGSNAVMLSNALQINPSLATPSIADSNTPEVADNQYELLSAYETGGTPPYTYNFIVYNSVTKIQVANMLTTSNTFLWQVTGNTGNTINANVSVSDSATTSYEANSIHTSTITVVNSMLAAGLLSESNTAIDNGQFSTLYAGPSGGAPPYTINFFSQADCMGASIGSGNSVTLNPSSSTTYSYNVVDSAATPYVACSQSNTITVNSILSTPSISPSNATIASGQSVSLNVSWQGFAAPAIDGTASSVFTSASSGSVTLSTSTSNDLIVVYSGAENPNMAAFNVLSVSDTAGLTWTKRAATVIKSDHNGAYDDQEVWYAIAPRKLSSDLITVTLNSIIDDGTVMAFAANGINTTTPWDTNPYNPSNNMLLGATTVAANVLASTSNSHDLIFGFAGSDSFGSGHGSSNGYVPADGNYLTLTSIGNFGGSNAWNSGMAYNSFTTAQSGSKINMEISGVPLSADQYWMMIGDAAQAAKVPGTTSGTPPYTAKLYSSSTSACNSGSTLVQVISVLASGNAIFSVSPASNTFYCAFVTDSASTALTYNTIASQITVNQASAATSGNSGSSVHGSAGTSDVGCQGCFATSSAATTSTTSVSSSTSSTLPTTAISTATSTMQPTTTQATTAPIPIINTSKFAVISANISASNPVAVDFYPSGTDLEFYSSSQSSARMGVMLEDVQGQVPAPPGYSALSAVNISSASNVSKITLTMHYPCGTPSNSIAPYMLEGGSWIAIMNYTVDTSACTVELSVHNSITVALISSNSMPAQSGLPFLELGIIAAVALMAASSLYLYLRGKGRKA